MVHSPVNEDCFSHPMVKVRSTKHVHQIWQVQLKRLEVDAIALKHETIIIFRGTYIV